MNDPLASSIVSALLRYFREGELVAADGSRIEEADRDMLRLHWSISSPVFNLVEYVRRHPHELRSSLDTRRTTSPNIRGNIDFAESVREQLRTADPSIFVFNEAYRSHESGPNRVLFWTVSYAALLGRRFRSLLPAKGSYALRTVAVLRSLENARRLLPLPEPQLLRVPSPDDVRAARGSRSPLYRRAAEAYQLLRSIERLDPYAMTSLLGDTLVGPMERWRQFEFALGLGMADAIASVTGGRPHLHYIGFGVPDPLVTVGPFAILWQRPGPLYDNFMLEAWERRAVDILAAFDVRPGWDRPDIVVVDTHTQRAIAVGEAKYFESASWRDAFRGAATQIVDYARGYEKKQGNVEEIIARSVIALWDANEPLLPVEGQPLVATFSTLQPTLQAWANRLWRDGVFSVTPFAGSDVLSKRSGSGGQLSPQLPCVRVATDR